MSHQCPEDKLRKQAEKRLSQSRDQIQDMNRQDVNHLVEELQIHQVELEIQNEELRDAQVILEANRNRYISLFDNAPNGYVVLDSTGIIQQYNSTFLEMMGKPVPTGTAFADLLLESDNAIFRGRYGALFKAPNNKTADYRLNRANGKDCHIHIKARTHNKPFYTSDTGSQELLLMISDVTELTRTKHRLESSLSNSRAKEAKVRALLAGARAVLEQKEFEKQARSLFDICSKIIGSTSGYVALLDETGKENKVLFLEAGDLPCTVDPDLPMPVRGLRQEAYKKKQPVFDNNFMNSEWEQYMPRGHVRLDNVMFAPLITNKNAVGVIGLANKPSPFTNEDARIAGGFGELCAIALQNSLNLDKRDEAEQKNNALIKELKQALANVKQLSGLLPICSHCKKIRDDKGYWEQIESYLSEHTEAIFSHGICQECAVKHYPDLDLYND